MDLGNSIFAEGQIYVALSRLSSIKGLYLNSINFNKIKSNKKVIEFYKKLN